MEGSFGELLAPVLDTYLNAAVGLTGCRSRGLARAGCEHDLLIVRPEKSPPTTLKIGTGFVDLAFATERELLGLRDPEVAASLAFMKPVRDTRLVLSTCISSALESLQRNYQRSAQERLAASVKAMGRAEEAASRKSDADSGFWLASAAYDLARAFLYSTATVPSPSHLLSQLRLNSPGHPGMFEAFSRAAGLDGASRATCEARLEALGVIYDLMEIPAGDGRLSSSGSVRASYELLGSKMTATLHESQAADAYSYLGLEIARCLPTVMMNRLGRRETSEVLGPLSGGQSALLARSVVESLGVARSPEATEAGLASLREQVSALTRRA